VPQADLGAGENLDYTSNTASKSYSYSSAEKPQKKYHEHGRCSTNPTTKLYRCIRVGIKDIGLGFYILQKAIFNAVVITSVIVLKKTKTKERDQLVQV